MAHTPWGPPQPPPAGWPPPPPPKTNGGLLVGLSIGLAVLLVATLGIVHAMSQPRQDAATSGQLTPSDARTPRSGSTADRRATAAPPSRQPTDRTSGPSSGRSRSSPAEKSAPDLSLKNNTLYSIELRGEGSCSAKIRRPKPPLRNSALAPYLRTVLRCLVGAFKDPLAKSGFTLTTPKVRTFTGSVKTPCGTLGSRSNPAFYCAGTIYWPVSSDDEREAYTFARLGYVGLLAHEFGHHIQATTGILNDYGSTAARANRTARLALSRRLELQAQCFEGVFLFHDRRAIDLSRRDRTDLRTWHSYTGDEDPPKSRKPDHGTSRAQLAWLFAGLAGGDLGRCNTWSASARSVR